MTVSVLRPDATSVNGWTVTGASAHAALSDSSDASYITATAVQIWSGGGGGLGNLTVPAGAVIKTLALRVRTAYVGTPGNLVANHDMGDGRSVGTTIAVNWTTPTTVTVDTQARYPYNTETEVDAGGPGLTALTGTIRVYEYYLDVTYVGQPTLTVDAPAGTVSDTNLPTVTWTPTLDSDGGPQGFYRVKIFSQAQYSDGGFNPDTSTPTADSDGALSAVTSWQSDEILADGLYRAYVRIAQVVNGNAHLSDWEYSSFEIDVALPAVPDITAAADNANARISLVIDDNAGAATTDEIEVQRSLDGGTTWEIVRQLVAGNFDEAEAPVTLHDYECENGVAAHYRARALHDYSGVFAASAWGTDSTTWASSEWWLKHPHRPDLNMPVVVRAFPSLSRQSRQGVFQALGSSSPIVVSDTRGPKTGQVTLRAYTLDDQAALDALLDTNAVLLLQSPPAKGGPGYVVVGNHDRQRIFETDDASRVWEVLDITVVDSPPGDVVAWPA